MRTFGPNESSAAGIDDEWMQTPRFPLYAELVPLSLRVIPTPCRMRRNITGSFGVFGEAELPSASRAFKNNHGHDVVSRAVPHF
jgi:hypothetical protein